jgi:hypothetical protein
MSQEMEKLGVSDENLLKELQLEYQSLKEKEAELVKTGSDASSVHVGLSAIKERMNKIRK